MRCFIWRVLLFGCLLILHQEGKAQSLSQLHTFTNRHFTDTRYSLDADYEWVHSAPLSNGKLAVAAHSVSSGDVDIKLVVLDNTGTVDWEKTLDNSNHDYGVRVLVDGSNNVYVVGTTHFTLSNQDLVVVKYNSSGTHQFTTYWDSGSNLGDIPVDALVASDGNLYITGIANRSTESITSDEDYFTLRMSSTGNVDWSEVYDHANLVDIPVALAANAQNVFVTGSTFTTSTQRQTTTLKYQMATGVRTQLALKNSTNNEYATHIMLDDDDNLYITGRSHSGQHFDANVVKYTDDFYKIWEQTFDGFGRDDQAIFSRLNGSTLYVAAEGKNANSDTCAYLLSFDTAGTADDTLILEPNNKGGGYTIADMDFDNGYVYATVNGQESSQNPRALVLTLNDDFTLQHQYTCAHNHGAALRTAHFTSSGLYLSGVSFDDANPSSTLTQYLEYWHITEQYEDDTLEGDSVKLLQNGLLVGLNANYMKTANTNKKGMSFGKLNDFLKPWAVNELTTEFSLAADSFTLVKIYPKLTSADTMVTSRAGRQFRTYNAHTQYKLYLASSINLSSAKQKVDNLRGFTNAFFYQMPQNCGVWPNDSRFSSHQFCLHPNPNATKWQNLGLSGNPSMNMPRAWDVLDYYGDTTVVVGVVEGRHPYFKHEDFNDANGDVFGAFIDYGGDSVLRSNISFPSIDVFLKLSIHATKMGGHIGALRHNNMGIVGVAGGNASRGVKLNSYYAGNSSRAYRQMANDGVPIHNHSYSASSVEKYSGKDALLYNYHTGGITVASRGNWTDDGPQHPSTSFPFVISVGSYGQNGNYRYRTNDDLNKIEDWVSEKGYANYGRGMDVLGPGCTALTMGTVYDPNDKNIEYQEGNESSSAAAHVTGVAALLYGYDHDVSKPSENLYAEDIETLLELGAYDLTTAGLTQDDIDDINGDLGNRPLPQVGYDDLTGWGRVNAGSSAEFLAWPHYKIIHYFENSTHISQLSVSGNTSPVVSGMEIAVAEDFHNDEAPQYKADQYKLTYNVTFSIPTAYSGYHVHNSTRYPDGGIWPLPSESNLLDTVDSTGYLNRSYRHLKLESKNPTSRTASFSGYLYKLTHLKDSNGVYQLLNTPIYYPFSPGQAANNVKLAFSVHLEKDGTGVDEVEETGFEVFPNPTNQYFILQFKEAPTTAVVTLFDLMGKPIIPAQTLVNPDAHTFNLVTFPPGNYLLTVKTQQGAATRRIIKL